MKGIEKFYKFAGSVSKIVYPWVCCVCGTQKNCQSGVCKVCAAHLPWCAEENLCEICGLPITAKLSTSNICGECQKSPPYYDHIRACFWYRSPIYRLITDYKYLSKWENAHTLVDLSLASLAELSKTGLVIPMPSHPTRICERGFNAVYELIKSFSKLTAINYDLTSVLRTKYTQAQTGKLKTQRRSNVKGAFTVVKPINYDHVIIFDEVVTTAATVNELSRCLKKSGVKRVTVWAIARTK